MGVGQSTAVVREHEPAGNPVIITQEVLQEAGHRPSQPHSGGGAPGTSVCPFSLTRQNVLRISFYHARTATPAMLFCKN